MYSKQNEILDGADIIQALVCPEGYLPCDGSSYYKDDYPVIGSVLPVAYDVIEHCPVGSMVLPDGMDEIEFRADCADWWQEPTLLGSRYFLPYKNGKMLYSDDFGVTWLSAQLPGLEAINGHINISTLEIAWNGGTKLVFVSRMISLDNQNSRIYYSHDFGVTWTKSTSGVGVSAGSRPIYHRGKFLLLPHVMTTRNDRINEQSSSSGWVSSDNGVTWQSFPLPENSVFAFNASPTDDVISWITLRSISGNKYSLNGVVGPNSANFIKDYTICFKETAVIPHQQFKTMIDEDNNYPLACSHVISNNRIVDYSGSSMSKDFIEYKVIVFWMNALVIPNRNDAWVVVTKTDMFDYDDTGESRQFLILDVSNDTLRQFNIPQLNGTLFPLTMHTTNDATGLQDIVVSYFDGDYQNWENLSFGICILRPNKDKFVTPYKLPENGLNFYIKAV